jgi:hypothetical protein
MYSSLDDGWRRRCRHSCYRFGRDAMPEDGGLARNPIFGILLSMTTDVVNNNIRLFGRREENDGHFGP